MEAEVAPHFEKCDNMGPMEDKEGCIADAEALLQELKDKHCHPKPNCWEEANANYDEAMAMCEMYDNDEEIRACEEKAKDAFDQHTE